MVFSINLSSPEPIYNQIIQQIKDLLENGDLNGGDPLPSIRALAMQLDISINTVARAYRELESEGFIESNGRRGSYIKINWKQESNNELFSGEIVKLLQAGLNKKQILQLFRVELEKQTGV